MRALTFHGPRDLHVDTVPDPALLAPDDIIVRVTATAIAGADLHIYHGRLPGVAAGDILGHEFVGVVEETGRGVSKLRRGDRVAVPFVIACGQCFHCAMQLFASCSATNTRAAGARQAASPTAALFGFGAQFGGVAGGQAQYVRVPCADAGPLRLPEKLPDERALFLGNILATGYQAAHQAGLMPGSSVAIFGAGPVGLMTAACARLLGAEKLFMVDRLDYRLAFAQQAYGAVPVNFERVGDPAAFILQETHGGGVDAAIDAVGFEAQGSALEDALTTLGLEDSNGQALRRCMAAVRSGGTVSVPGMYAGLMHGFQLGEAFEKGISLRLGRTHVQRWLPRLLQHVERGDLKPEQIISHRLSLEQAPEGYHLFDEKLEECRKVVLTP